MTTVKPLIFEVDEAQGKLWDGGWRDASEMLPVREPATGRTLLEVGQASAEDVAHAARTAASAQRAWA
ncbi:MAG: aldehyde dehydrogenase family protein, partial [Solirubrobacterales bacterium]|nr:aldehyde dehydrogenase family protein [Solirubrobacterales bacterium]